MIYKNREYVLSTGRKFYANFGILGLTPFEEKIFDEDLNTIQGLQLYNGYYSHVTDQEKFTRRERHEIADFMIEVWKKWAHQ